MYFRKYVFTFWLRILRKALSVFQPRPPKRLNCERSLFKPLFCLKSERPQLCNRNSVWGDSNAHVLCYSSSFWRDHFIYVCTFWKCPFALALIQPLWERTPLRQFFSVKWPHSFPEYSSTPSQANLLSWAPNLHVDFACTLCVCSCSCLLSFSSAVILLCLSCMLVFSWYLLPC